MVTRCLQASIFRSEPNLKYKPAYFCHQCKKISHNVETLLLVEDFASRSFCSDACIVQFFSPLINHYEKEEKEIRKSLTFNKESCLIFRENSYYIQKTLENPIEVWENISELGEKLYVYVARHEEEDFPFWMVMILYLYHKVPSFVFFQTVTNSPEVLDQYRRGHKIENIPEFFAKRFEEKKVTVEAVESESPATPKNNEVQVELTNEMMDQLEQKKSMLLAHLLSNRKESDINFENFYLYEKNVPLTIESPDEIYTYQDDEGDELLVYLRGFQEASVSFYFVVICNKLDVKTQSSEDEVIYPILAFPTLDATLAKLYCHGEKLSGGLKN